MHVGGWTISLISMHTDTVDSRGSSEVELPCHQRYDREAWECLQAEAMPRDMGTRYQWFADVILPGVKNEVRTGFGRESMKNVHPGVREAQCSRESKGN